MTRTSSQFTVDTSLKEEYKAYVQTTLEDIEKILSSDDGNLTPIPWDDIKRHLHTLKGTGTSYGFPEITALAGSLEDSLKQKEFLKVLELKSGLDKIRQVVAPPK